MLGRPSNIVSRGKGPSKGKAKGPDPGNWGGADFLDKDTEKPKSGDALRVTHLVWVKSL